MKYQQSLFGLVVASMLLQACSDEDVATTMTCGDRVVPVNDFIEDFEDGSGIPDPLTGVFNADSVGNNVWRFNADLENNPNPISLDTNFARNGSQSVRFSVDPGDIAAGKNRAEIANRTEIPICTEGYYAWSFMLDPNYVESGDFQVVGQWHAIPDLAGGETWQNFSGTAPPVTMSHEDGELFLNISRISEYDQEFLGALNNSSRTPITRGVWVDVVFHVKWSLASDGFVQAWIRNDPALDYEPITPFNDETGDYKVFAPTAYNQVGNYIKFGLYRGNTADATGVVYYDRIRFGNSFDFVAAP